VIDWEQFHASPVEADQLDRQPDHHARFETLQKPLSDGTMLRSLSKDFQDWVYRESEVSVRANEALKVYAGPEVSSAEFRTMCTEAARQGRDAEIDKVSDSFDTKIEVLMDRLKREQRELAEDQSELSQRKMEEMGTHAETLLSMFGKRRRSLSSSLSKRRMTEKAKADVEESLDAIQDLEKDIADLKREMDEALQQVNERWGEIANQVEEISVRPYKKDILLDLFGVAWMPYHLVQIGKELVELPGYGAN
jgi:DNA repair exonuclease SbcCD ATPase subunit